MDIEPSVQNEQNDPNKQNEPEAPPFLVGRELSPGEIDQAIEYLKYQKHKANGGTVRGEDGRVDPVKLALEIRARMPY